MLILISAVLFAFGFLLFSFGITMLLIGLVLRIAIRLFQLMLLILLAGIAVYNRLQQHSMVQVLDGEHLPPQKRLPHHSQKRTPGFRRGELR
jgi:hypothetical protein